MDVEAPILEILGKRVEPGAVVVDQSNASAFVHETVSSRTYPSRRVGDPSCGLKAGLQRTLLPANGDLAGLSRLHLGQVNGQDAILALRGDFRVVNRFVDRERSVEVTDLELVQQV